jgi:hypothetical protein
MRLKKQGDLGPKESDKLAEIMTHSNQYSLSIARGFAEY